MSSWCKFTKLEKVKVAEKSLVQIHNTLKAKVTIVFLEILTKLSKKINKFTILETVII